MRRNEWSHTHRMGSKTEHIFKTYFKIIGSAHGVRCWKKMCNGCKGQRWLSSACLEIKLIEQQQQQQNSTVGPKMMCFVNGPLPD